MSGNEDVTPEKYSRLAVLSFALSMFLAAVLILSIAGIVIAAEHGVHKIPETYKLYVGLAAFLYVIGLLLSIIFSIYVLVIEKRSRNLTAIGLISQLLVFSVIIWSIWEQVRPAKISNISIIEYGLYHSTVSDSTVTDDKTHSRVYLRRNITLVEKTDTVRTAMGTTFGFRYVVEGDKTGKSVDIKIVDLYPSPGLADPMLHTAKRSTHRNLNTNIGDTLWTAFSFDYKWEMVPGSWTFQIWSKEKKLAEKVFTVIAK